LHLACLHKVSQLITKTQESIAKSAAKICGQITAFLDNIGK